MNLHRIVLGLLVTLLCMAPQVMAQSASNAGSQHIGADSVSAPTITSLRFVGHNRVIDSVAATDGWLTLGDDGLIVRWSLAGIPQAWHRIDSARHLVRSAGQLAVLTDAALIPLNESSLQEGLHDPHDSFVRCADKNRFWRWRNEGELLYSAGSRETQSLRPSFEPAPEAVCMVEGEESLLVWLDGDELRVILEDGAAHAWPWTLATPSLAAVDGAPVAIAIDESGARVALRLRDGLVAGPDGVEVSSGCFAWDAQGLSACGPTTPEHWITQSLLPQVIVPMRSVVSDDLWIATWPGGWFVVSSSSEGVQVFSAESDTILGVTGGRTPRIIVCRSDDSSAQLIGLSALDGAEVARVTLGECPVRPWFGDDAFMGATSDGTVLFQGDVFTFATLDSAVSASAPWGRNQITFVLARVFDPSCPAQVAWTLQRRAAEGEPEPVLGAQCATDAELRPLLDETGLITGAVVMLRESRRWRSRGFALAGNPLFDLTYTTNQPGELRWIYDLNGDVQVDDFEQLSTRVQSGDGWSRVALRVHRGTTPVTLGSESLVVTRAAGSVECGGSGTGWWCYDDMSFWVSEDLARQVVLVLSDGRVVGSQHPEFRERRRDTPFASDGDR